MNWTATVIPTETVSETQKPRFETVFVSYGAGKNLFKPIVSAKWWNVICWATIAVGTLGWTVDLVVYYSR